MASRTPFINDSSDHSACWICPALRLPAGYFDVHDKPSGDCPFDPETGFRFDARGVAVCVHPYKIGVPAAPYASQGLPFPAVFPRPAEIRRPPAPEPEPVLVRPYPGPPPETVSDAEIMAGARPAVPGELLSWMRGLVRDAAPEDLQSTLDQAEAAALRRFPTESVVEALRRVLGGG